jgi:hypothetical protein
MLPWRIAAGRVGSTVQPVQSWPELSQRRIAKGIASADGWYTLAISKEPDHVHQIKGMPD